MAAGEVTAASTLIASILEHQGLLTQARILDSFQGFFRDAGALLYLIAGIGAVVSVLMYGSFRAPRYLIIGPALFWFLVGPRAENVDGVIWQLGGGSPLGLNGETDPDAKYRDEILKKSGFNPEEQPKVAQGFWLFARTINELTNEIVDVLLKDEDRSDLVVASRAYGLELISTGKIDEGQLLSRMEQGLMLNCQEMMAEAQAAANVLVKKKAGNTNAQDAQLVQAAYDEHVAEMKRLGDSKFIDTRYNNIGADLKAAGATKNNGQAIETISCTQAWELLAQEVWHRSAAGMARVIRVASQGVKRDEAVEYTCAGLIRKGIADRGLNADDAGVKDCNFQPAIALSLLNNHLTQSHAYNRVFNRHWNEGAHKNPRTLIALTSGAQGLHAGLNNRAAGFVVNTIGQFGHSVGLLSAERVDDVTVKYTLGSTSVTVLQQEYGMNDAMWVSTRQYKLAELRQHIFSYAFNIPYYQGMLLFIIAVMYPFMALIVLLPGKAIGFLNVPLAWLWVKSWDIGFAAIIILDKVLFNLLPSPNIDQQLRTGPWTNIELLPKVLAEAYNFDPIGSLHNYYAMLAFAWLAVPVITGAATLKAKRGVLSMFPEAAAKISGETAEAAGNAYSIQAQDKRSVMLKELMGSASKLPISGGNEIGGGRAGVVGKAYGAMTLASRTGQAFSAADLGNGKFAGLTKIASAENAALDAYRTITEKDTQFQSALARAHDPVMGRWSDMGILQGSYLAAMDGGGGYEIYDKDESAGSAYIALEKAKIRLQNDALINATQGFTEKVASGVLSGALKGEKVNAVAQFGDAGMVLTAMLAATTGAQDSHAMRKALGADGYSMAEFRQMFTNELPQPLQTTMHTNTDAAIQRDSFEAVFARPAAYQAPGGFSQFLNLSLSTVGGDRKVEYVHAPDVAAQLQSRTVTESERTERTNGVGTRIITEPVATAGAALVGAFDAFTPNGGNAGISRSNQVFEGSLIADRGFQQAMPEYYQQQVTSRTAGLEAFYGQANIKDYFTSINQPVAGTITPEHVFEYSKHVYEKSLEAPSPTGRFIYPHVQENGLDLRYQGHADENPLAALEAIDHWLSKRGVRSNSERVVAVPIEDAPFINQPYQLWSPNNEK